MSVQQGRAGRTRTQPSRNPHHAACVRLLAGLVLLSVPIDGAALRPLPPAAQVHALRPQRGAPLRPPLVQRLREGGRGGATPGCTSTSGQPGHLLQVSTAAGSDLVRSFRPCALLLPASTPLPPPLSVGRGRAGSPAPACATAAASTAAGCRLPAQSPGTTCTAGGRCNGSGSGEEA